MSEKMLFPSVGGYMLANYKMLIPSEGGYMLRKNVISKRRRLYVEEHRSYNLFHNIFPPILRSFLRQSDFDKIFKIQN